MKADGTPAALLSRRARTARGTAPAAPLCRWHPRRAAQLSFRSVSPTEAAGRGNLLLISFRVMRRDIESIDDVIREITDVVERHYPQADLEAWRRDFAEVIRAKFGESTPPSPNETVAVAPLCAKAAALLYDRVWATPVWPEQPPRSIVAYGGTPAEVLIDATLAAARLLPNIRRDLITALRQTPLGSRVFKGSQHPARAVAEGLSLTWKNPITPIYSDIADRDADYRRGCREVVVIALREIAIVDEAATTWDQVEEFRRDTESRRHLRRLLSWADADLVGKPSAAVAHELATRLEKYEFALRKHGIGTVIGTVESIIDPTFIAAATAIVGGVAWMAGVTGAAAAGVSLALGKAAVTAAKGLLDLEEARRSQIEIAYLYQAKKRLGGAG